MKNIITSLITIFVAFSMGVILCAETLKEREHKQTNVSVNWCYINSATPIKLSCIDNVMYFSFLGGISPKLTETGEVINCSCNR